MHVFFQNPVLFLNIAL